MSDISNRRNFLVTTASASAAAVVASSLAACGGSDATPSTFNYGVASGDPLADRVILWTHAKIPGSTNAVGLSWQVASDSTFATVLKSGRLVASEATGFTAKVDVTGLTSGASYFYRFTDDAGVVSTVGTTRTLPTSSATSVKLAVFSCTLFSAGYFNTYDAAAKSDAQYAIHLGDYIYEYGSDPAKFGNTNVDTSITAVTLNRVTSPANDIVSLSDYRTRYALYKSDLNLQALHAKMPWITIWDDHEFANNAYMTGAENHNPATQGDWTTRKNNAAQAYHEWLPIRTPDTANLLKIYRSFDFGNLLSLHMLDTRIEGRVQQYDNFGDTDGGVTRYLTAMAMGTDAARTMISATQQSWLTDKLTASTATWQFLGNQDIMARMWFPASVLSAQATAIAAPTQVNGQAVMTAISDYLTAKGARYGATLGGPAITQPQADLLNTNLNPTIPYNLDAWDGYPSNREAVLQTILGQGKKLVALSGDSHNAWFTNLTTLNGTKVGVEFAGSSVTSPGFESAGLGGLASSLDGTAVAGPTVFGSGLGLVDDLNYSNTTQRGYLLMTVTAAAVKGEYVFMSTVTSKTYTPTIGKTITVTTTGAVTYA
ncbi:MAG: alkaline phosphatase D family protein [Rhodoferax sp.]|uniref:alkaline phosphatase D family protein n=1 Tax=Rhodoferax sp. TaxID=50421 RepID=UPI003015BE92